MLASLKDDLFMAMYKSEITETNFHLAYFVPRNINNNYPNCPSKILIETKINFNVASGLTDNFRFLYKMSNTMSDLIYAIIFTLSSVYAII